MLKLNTTLPEQPPEDDDDDDGGDNDDDKDGKLNIEQPEPPVEELMAWCRNG